MTKQEAGKSILAATSIKPLRDLIESDELAKEYKNIFVKFSKDDVLVEDEEPTESKETIDAIKKAEIELQIKEEESKKQVQAEKLKDEKDKFSHLSRKERKRRREDEISLLKKTVERPDLVESQDMNSRDPHFLIYLKSIKNSVPVPRHWTNKYRYLGHKRSLEQSRYKIPEFLLNAGISGSMRTSNAFVGKTAKQLARERARPRLGKIDVDYQSLHDAFFKHQKKYYLPKLKTRLKIHNQLYYENEEFQGIFRHKRLDRKNNKLSNKLRLALGMTSRLTPPAWLKNMQRYGPPLSYPGLKIPGLNAPIPEGASFGDHVNGWGRPPVDLQGQPLYGLDVFSKETGEQEEEEDNIVHWGDLESDEEFESEDEDDDEDMELEDDEVVKETKYQAEPQVKEKITSKEVREEDEDNQLAVDRELDLRKVKANIVQREKKASTEEKDKKLFVVLEEQKAEIKKTDLVGNNYTYNLSGHQDTEEISKPKNKEVVEQIEQEEDEDEEDFKF